MGEVASSILEKRGLRGRSSGVGGCWERRYCDYFCCKTVLKINSSDLDVFDVHKPHLELVSSPSKFMRFSTDLELF